MNLRMNFVAVTGLAVSLIIAVFTTAEAQPRMREANDISLIGAPSLSGMLAVTLVQGEKKSIRFIDLENREVLEFPAPFANVGYPAFSPDGERIAFVGKTRRGNEVFTSRWFGGEVHRVTFNTLGDGNPSWSADGARVNYFSEHRKYKSEIVTSLVAAPFTTTHITDVGGGNTTPRESPDSRHLAYTTDRYAPSWNVCVIDLETKSEVCPFRTGRVSNCRAAWSPDGSQFAYSVERGPSVDLHIYTTTTGKTQKITSLPHKEYDAVWSPDGDYIAFAHDPTGLQKYDIKAVRLVDKKVIPIAKATGSLRYLSWSTSRPYLISGDLCPTDPLKTKPGTCGCGAPDRDTDGDTIPDCDDGCPTNPKKHIASNCK